MVLGCVVVWVVACACAIQHFAFRGLGWDGQSGGGRYGLGVLTVTHQDRERYPGNGVK